jgi:cellulose synthase/poly-beta-1,6-N-acetylglucosamine synthase-like glycosyltransferase
MADYSLFLYLLYLALSLLVGVVATSTFIWMMNAWRTPDSLEADGRKDNGQPARYSFSLIVPARDEELVLPNTLARIMSSDHPDFEVLVVVGDNDPGTQAVAEQLAGQYPDRIKVIVYSASPKSKPKALNAALQHCGGEITGIFDAEDDVHPALLRRVDQAFGATEADVVQAGVQLMNFRSHWFTVHNVLEYYFWFRSRLHVHARQRFIPLGGNTVFVRTAVLRSVGGWYDCLTEDCEIGVRLSTLGAHTAVFYEPELVTREECPPTVRDFIKQRTRWNQGFLQTLGRGYWRRLPLRQRALGAYILANPYVMALSWLMIPAAIATAVLIKEPVGITLLSFLPVLPMLGMLVAEGVAIAEFCRTYGERARLVDYLRLVGGLLPYQALLAYAAGRAVVRQARGTNSWHTTTHLGQHISKAAVADATVVGSAAVGGDPPRPAARVLLAEPPAAGAGDLVPMPRPGAGPLWARLDDSPELSLPAGSGPDGPVRSRPVPPRRVPRAAVLAGGWWWLQGRRIDLSVQLVLLVIAGTVLITNLTHWPSTQFDEGTYVSYAWSLQHGRLANYTFSYGHPPLGWMLIFLWTEAQGLFGPVVFSIDHTRELMALVFLASCSLLYILARRLGFSWPAAAAAVLAMALTPLGVFFHRAVLLDNPSMTLAIAAFVLAWDPRRRLWAFVGSGACFALSVLCKETSFDLLPAVLFAVVQNADRRTRVYCVTLFLAAFALVGGFYPLYATLKHELLPGPGHVSLLGYLIVQLLTRKASGSVFNAQSQSHQEVLAWLQLDPWLLFAALALVPLALMRRSTRAIAIALLIQVAVVLKPGYLPNMYVIGMLPFAALIVPGSLDALWRWAGQIRFSACTWTARTAVAAATILVVAFVVGPRWAAGDHTAMTVRMDIPERSAELWLTGHVSHSSRIIVVDQYWLYLVEHGYNDQPMRGGFFSDTVVSYWPLDYDPAVSKAFPGGWREFDYVVVNEDMLATLPQTPSAGAAIAHSQVIASFGQGVDRVQIRKISPTGLNQPG